MAMSKEDLDRLKDEEKFKELFHKLDTNGDGTIQFSELIEALHLKSVKDAKSHAETIFSSYDTDGDNTLSLSEFVGYMREHTDNIRKAFVEMDKNQDGVIEPCEVQEALSNIGIDMTLSEAEKMIKRLDSNNDGTIDWDEWFDFFNLTPSDDLEEMFVVWRQGLMIDIGDQISMPPDFTRKERLSGAWWRHLVSEGIGTACSRTLTAPMERVKVMQMAYGHKIKNFTTKKALQIMIKKGGIKSLWRGNIPNMLKIAPESAIRFTIYEDLKIYIPEWTGNRTGIITHSERWAAGLGGVLTSQTMVYPFELLKTRMATSHRDMYRNPWDCAVKTYKEAGLGGFYRGYMPNMYGIFPHIAADVIVYEGLKALWQAHHSTQDLPTVPVLLLSGTISSTCGQIATYPILLVRTRFQTRLHPVAGDNSITMSRDILKKQGIRGFFHGIIPNLAKVVPAVTISCVIYEKMKAYYGIG